VTGGWRKLHNEELHNLYPSPNIIIMMKLSRMIWVAYVARKRKSNAYGVSVGNPDGKRPLRRKRRRWLDNIKNGSERDRIGSY
jgi:hypothetical protein